MPVATANILSCSICGNVEDNEKRRFGYITFHRIGLICPYCRDVAEDPLLLLLDPRVNSNPHVESKYARPRQD